MGKIVSPTGGVPGPFGSRRLPSLRVIFPPELVKTGEDTWAVIPSAVDNRDFINYASSFTLYVGGVAQGAVGVSFTNATKGAEFVVVEKITGPGIKASFVQSNRVFVPAAPTDTNLQSALGDWSADEASDDADTRRTQVYVNKPPRAAGRFSISRTSTPPPADPAGLSLADMTGSGSSWAWKSTGQAAVGSPTNRTPQYIVVVERDAATDTNRRYCSEVILFYASSTPTAPVISVATGAGAQEVDVTIVNAAGGSGRAITGYKYSIDGTNWLTLPGGDATGKRTISGLGFAQIALLRVRGVNANGDGVIASAGPVTPGAAATKPAIFTGAMAGVIDSPSSGGDQGTLNVIAFPADGGSTATGCFYKINGGSEISFGLTPGSVQITSDTPEADTSVAIYLRNAIGDSDPYTMTFRPSKTTASTTTSPWGGDTPAGTGGWKPTNALGDEIDILSIDSQAGATRAWQVVGGALVASDGTPAADNGKTITVNLLGGGQIAALIATTANARSVRTDAELVAAAATGLYAVPASVYLRPTVFTGISGATQFIGSRTYASTARRTFTKHPGQVKKPQILNTELTSTALTYCTIDNFRFTMNAGSNKTIWRGDSANVNNNTFSNCDFEGPEVPLETLMSTAAFPSGYTAVPTAISAARSVSMTYDGNTFARMYSVANLGTGGAFRLTNCSIDKFYYDGFRLWPNSDNTPKIIKNIEITGAFAVNNEMQATTGGLEPHNDPFQVIGSYGELRNCLVMNVAVFRGPYRGNVMSFWMGNAGFRYCTFHNIIGYNTGVWIGVNMETSRWTNISNAVFMSANGTSNLLRFGGPSGSASFKAVGEHVLTNVYVGGNSGTLIQVNANSEAVDRGSRTRVNCVDGTTANPLDYFKGPFGANIVDIATLRDAFSAKDGSVSVGPLDQFGNWRTEIHAPLRSDAPDLYHSGADLVIAPKAPLLSAESVGAMTWDYQYRNADGATWTKVTGLTGASATLVAPNKTGIQVQIRWRSSTGFPAPWSLTQTTIVAGSTAMIAATAPTISRSGTTVTLLAHGTYTANGSPVTPDSYGYTKTINGAQTSWDGSGFTIQPGDTWSIAETPVKSGYTGTSNPSAEASYPILSLVTAPVIQISGNTVTLLSGPVWSDTPDSVTPTKVVAGSETSWDGSAAITTTAGQSCYVKYAPVKAGYYVPAAALSNTVTSASGTVLTEDWSSYTDGDTFTQLDTLYGRNASNIDALVAADAAAPAAKRISLTMSTSAAGYLRRDDTIKSDGTWGRFQIRARIKTQVHNNARGGVGWGPATVAFGIQVRRGSSSGTNTIVFLNGGDMSASTGGTTLFSSIADGAAYDLLLDIASDKRTLSYKVWASGGSEPGSYDGSVTLGADASLSGGLRLFGGNVSTGGNTGIRCLAWRLGLDTDAVAF